MKRQEPIGAPLLAEIGPDTKIAVNENRLAVEAVAGEIRNVIGLVDLVAPPHETRDSRKLNDLVRFRYGERKRIVASVACAHCVSPQILIDHQKMWPHQQSRHVSYATHPTPDAVTAAEVQMIAL